MSITEKTLKAIGPYVPAVPTPEAIKKRPSVAVGWAGALSGWLMFATQKVSEYFKPDLQATLLECQNDLAELFALCIGAR